MYITKSNFKRIIRQLEIPEEFKFDDVVLWINSKGDEIRGDWDSRKGKIFSAIFSQIEKNRLLAFKAICKGDTKLIRWFYNKIDEPADSYKYIQAEKSPSYHSDPDCEAMKSDFERVYIPEQIKNQGVGKVMEFRNYWKEHQKLREKDFEAFIARVNIAFNLDPPIRGFYSETITNSGIQAIDDNRSVNEINQAISEVWENFTCWIKEDNPLRRLTCQELGYISWIVKSNKTLKDILDEDSLKRKLRIVLRGTRTEEELMDVLVQIDNTKRQLMDLLLELYIRSYIPDLDFSESLLKNLGFEPCSICALQEDLTIDLL